MSTETIESPIRQACRPALTLGSRVSIKEGATRFMRENGMYPATLPSHGIDGLSGPVIADYSDLAGNDASVHVMIAYGLGAAVHPDFIAIA